MKASPRTSQKIVPTKSTKNVSIMEKDGKQTLISKVGTGITSKTKAKGLSIGLADEKPRKSSKSSKTVDKIDTMQLDAMARSITTDLVTRMDTKLAGFVSMDEFKTKIEDVAHSANNASASIGILHYKLDQVT